MNKPVHSHLSNSRRVWCVLCDTYKQQLVNTSKLVTTPTDKAFLSLKLNTNYPWWKLRRFEIYSKHILSLQKIWLVIFCRCLSVNILHVQSQTNNEIIPLKSIVWVSRAWYVVLLCALELLLLSKIFKKTKKNTICHSILTFKVILKMHCVV